MAILVIEINNLAKNKIRTGCSVLQLVRILFFGRLEIFMP